jgi:DNA-binding NtrC family response regulator
MMNGIESVLIGETPAVRQLRVMVARVAPTDIPVLVEGPTGVGKELVARALHAGSGRSGRLVAFNVCAVAETMFEDALFGHVKGAFTGAASDAPGYLAEANGGTAFFDEIGELPLAPQAKLLRAVETREFRPVGARYDRRSDFRVVAATNRQLSELVAGGRFRSDLVHRLTGFVLRVPPLAERLDDVALLARHLLRNAPGRQCAELTPGAIALLREQPWPGNVRELRHVVERAAVFAPSSVVDRDAVFAALDCARPPVSCPPVSFARSRLFDVLERHGWDTERAAADLGVHRATVYRRMKRLGIPPMVPEDGCNHRRELRQDSPASCIEAPPWRDATAPMDRA